MLDAKVGLTEKNVKYNIKRYFKNFDAIKYFKFKKDKILLLLKVVYVLFVTLEITARLKSLKVMGK